MELRDYLRLVSRSWLAITLITLFGLALASAYCLAAPVRYEATAKVFVSIQQVASVQDLTQGSAFTQQQVKSYADLATTPAVLNPVIRDLKLQTTAAKLAPSVNAVAPLDTVVLSVSASAPTAAGAARIANEVSASLSTVVERLTPAAGSRTGSSVSLSTVQPAAAPSRPSSPRVALTLAAGLALGLAAGFLFAVMRWRLDTRVHSEAEITRLVSAPILGRTSYDVAVRTNPLVVADAPRSAPAEAYRAIRTNIQFLNVDATYKTIVFTSSIQGEGKSTTAVNTAISLADAGHAVLLVDADLRRPRVASNLGVDGSIGLTDVLVGSVALDKAIQKWGPAELSVIPAGAIPPNPSELLQSKSMDRFSAEITAAFDYVIFDAPPILPVTDALLLSQRFGGAVMVCAAKKVRRHQLQAAAAALGQLGTPVSGLIATMLRANDPSARAYGAYSYTYESDSLSA